MESVGFGACSLVFKTKRLTVLKQPLPGFEPELDFERRAYEHLGQHPRIARFLRQAGVALELEYYPRGCIDQAVARQAMETETEDLDLPCFKWAEQIAEALVFIHSKEVVHGDLRPANVLVTDAGDVVLADFASCSMRGVKVSDVSNKTRYRRRQPRIEQQPEEGKGDESQVTVQDDLFAFATLAYNLVTGKVPYEEHSDEEVVELYARGIFPDVSGVAMGGLILRCWQGGYSDATQVLKDIRRGGNSCR